MEQITKLLRDVVGNIRIMLLVMTILIIVVSGVGIFVSIYNSMSDRKREIAIMRALGARRRTVFSVIVAEAVLLCAGGGLVVYCSACTRLRRRPIVEAKKRYSDRPVVLRESGAWRSCRPSSCWPSSSGWCRDSPPTAPTSPRASAIERAL